MLIYEREPMKALAILRELSERPCEHFEELVRADAKNPFCRKCDSCIAGFALIAIQREATKQGLTGISSENP